MKMPSVSQQDVIDFLLRHVEKFVVAAVGILAMGLAWGGIDALRSQGVSAEKRPDALTAHARRTLEHIDRTKEPPDDAAPKTPSLTKLVAPWRAPQIAPAPEMALLDSPLFDELARRTKPDVLPIEDLHATAGVVVLALKNQQPGGMIGQPPVPDPPGPRPLAGRTKGKKPERDEPAAPPPQPFGFGGGGIAPTSDGTTLLPPGTITPFVVVTGLVPVGKQTDDYARRFLSTSLRDPKRDAPLWADYLIERSTVVSGGRETWERIDPKVVAKRARDQWAGMTAETVPPDFLLTPEQQPGSGGIGYCAPLPQLATAGWGPEVLHPWVRRTLDRLRAEREAAERQAADQPAGVVQQPDQPVFESPLAEPPAGAIAPPGVVQPPPNSPDGGVERLEYRMFRFVDLTVEPGKSYRYRVRLSVWNPNYNVPGQHLADATLAKDLKLPSPPSNVSAAVTVPDPVATLVRTLPKGETKRFKGMAEVLVLGPDSRTGNFALRGVITDLGGFVNVDRKLNKTGDQRTRGEEIFTDGLLIDMRGKQENREDLKTPKNAAPPEPLELLVMRKDGRFELVTAADSQEAISRYAATLPADGEAKPGARQPDEPSGGPPGGAPFSFPGLGPR